MRKISFSILGMVMGLALLTGCSKEESASPVTVDMAKKATIKVYAYAEQDETRTGYEKVPAGTKFTVMVSYSDLDINGDADGYWTEDVVTDANGTFTVEVPTVADGLYVYVVGNAFEGTVRKSSDVTKSGYFKANEDSQFVYPNDEAGMNFYYSTFEVIGNN